MSLHRRLVAVVLAVTAVLVSACVNIPDSGPVEKIAGQPPQCTNCVNVDVAPPAVGETPKGIVEGFLRANSNFQPAYAVARQFLTAAAAEQWSPEAGVQIYSGSSQAIGQRVVLAGQLLGRLGPDRSYSPANSKLSIDFGLVQERPGEWRINTPPEGLLVADYAFESFYQPFNLYFIGNGRSLVPDPIYLPNLRNQAGLASVLMKGLLNGPSRWLAPAVTTALPSGPAVSGDAVPISDGIAVVSLTTVVSTLNESQRRLLAAQVVYTLSQPLVGVSGVRFTLDGQPFSIPGLDPSTDVVTREAFADLNPVPPVSGAQLFAKRSRGVEVVNAAADVPDAKPIEGPLGDGAVDVSSLAVSTSGTDLAAVSNGGSVLQTAATANGGPVVKVLSGARRLLRPQYSRYGELWAIGESAAAAAGRQRGWVIGGGKQIPVTWVLPAGARVVAFRLSPDASRVGLVLAFGQRVEVGLMRIVRSQKIVVDGWRPLRLDRSSTADLVRFADVAWADATTLVTLAGPRGTAPLAPYRVDQDALEVTADGEANNWDAIGIAVSLQTQAAIVIGRNGQTWRNSGTQWIEYLDRVRAIAYPG